MTSLPVEFKSIRKLNFYLSPDIFKHLKPIFLALEKCDFEWYTLLQEIPSVFFYAGVCIYLLRRAFRLHFYEESSICPFHAGIFIGRFLLGCSFEFLYADMSICFLMREFSSCYCLQGFPSLFYRQEFQSVFFMQEFSSLFSIQSFPSVFFMLGFPSVFFMQKWSSSYCMQRFPSVF